MRRTWRPALRELAKKAGQTGKVRFVNQFANSTCFKFSLVVLAGHVGERSFVPLTASAALGVLTTMLFQRMPSIRPPGEAERPPRRVEDDMGCAFG